MIYTTPVRGTKDYLPEEMRMRDRVKDIILRHYQKNGFSRIQTPIMENIELLDKSDGGENLNMIFKILKRGQKLDLEKENLVENDLVDMGLRFDLTLPLSRYYINNRAKLMLPFKVIQIGEVFRAERPQKGRLREFYQCDIDIIGDDSIRAEIELIHTTVGTLKEIGFEDFYVKISDRRIIFELIESLGFSKEEAGPICIAFDKLDKIGKDGVREELKELDLPEEKIDIFIEMLLNNSLEDIKDKINNKEACIEVIEIIEKIEELGICDIRFDLSLIRGMGYYTGTIFEIVSPDFNSSIAGGGRYDKMIGKMSDEDVPAVGFSIGFERICQILLEKNETFEGNKRLALLYKVDENFVDVIKKADELRLSGYDVSTIVLHRKLAKQYNALEREGFSAALIFGDEEIKELNG